MNNKLIEKAVEKLKDLPKLKAIILFGSYARDEQDARSDIDLLIVLDSPHPKKYLKEIIQRISNIDDKVIISPRVTNLKDYDTSFFQNVLREGIILHGSLPVDPIKLALKPYRLIHYAFEGLKNTTKVKISRRVYGYYSIKGKKKYYYPGLKDDEGVSVLPTATVIVPESHRWFSEFLKRENVKYTEEKIWK